MGVLVHCLAGVSRSVSVTMAYLMHARLLNFDEAFALVRLRKPDISPNFHFLRQLHSYERQLMDENPSRMVSEHGNGLALPPPSIYAPFHMYNANQILSKLFQIRNCFSTARPHQHKQFVQPTPFIRIAVNARHHQQHPAHIISIAHINRCTNN